MSKIKNRVEALKELYHSVSKHSRYQILPNGISDLLSVDVKDQGKKERERFEFIEKHVDLKKQRILDIGGNTGYFTFEALSSDASFVNYFDGNSLHAQFVSIAYDILGKDDKIQIDSKNFNFSDINRNNLDPVDVCLCLNVLHHIGDDFGESSISVEEAKGLIATYLQNLSFLCNILVVQIGFNWKGNCVFPLFKYGTKAEMIDFVRECVGKYFDIINIGIATGSRDKIQYVELDDINIQRNDALGEFLNRPLFILHKR